METILGITMEHLKTIWSGGSGNSNWKASHFCFRRIRLEKGGRNTKDFSDIFLALKDLGILPKNLYFL